MAGNDEQGSASPTLFAIRGDASAVEVAALTAVLQALAASAAPPPAPEPVSEWARHRRLREPLYAGPTGWRASSLPR